MDGGEPCLDSAMIKGRRFKPLSIAAVSCAAALACTDAKAAAITETHAARHCVDVQGTRDEWTDLDEGDTCKVVAFELVRGSSPPVYYQLQVYLTKGQTPETERVRGRLIAGGPENDGAGVALLMPAHGGRTLTTLQGWKGGGGVITAPAVVRTPQGPILVVEMSADLSSNPTDDVAFRSINGKWVEMTDAWSQEVDIPEGLNQRHGNAMDWPTLRAYGALWKVDDAECCPTGGSYIAQLQLDGSTLRLGSIRYSRRDLPFP
jgi:hypothetical protein